MPDFESGVASYIHGQATVDVFFPVDKRGNADVCCFQCWYFRPEKEREIILSFFEGEERQTFLYCVGLHRLFCDQAYYDAIKKAVGDKLYEDFHK